MWLLASATSFAATQVSVDLQWIDSSGAALPLDWKTGSELVWREVGPVMAVQIELPADFPSSTCDKTEAQILTSRTGKTKRTIKSMRLETRAPLKTIHCRDFTLLVRLHAKKPVIAYSKTCQNQGVVLVPSQPLPSFLFAALDCKNEFRLFLSDDVQGEGEGISFRISKAQWFPQSAGMVSAENSHSNWRAKVKEMSLSGFLGFRRDSETVTEVSDHLGILLQSEILLREPSAAWGVHTKLQGMIPDRYLHSQFTADLLTLPPFDRLGVGAAFTWAKSAFHPGIAIEANGNFYSWASSTLSFNASVEFYPRGQVGLESALRLSYRKSGFVQALWSHLGPSESETTLLGLGIFL